MQLTKQEEFNDKILTIMDHINRGIDLIIDPQERLKLAGYNLVAGEKPKLLLLLIQLQIVLKQGLNCFLQMLGINVMIYVLKFT